MTGESPESTQSTDRESAGISVRLLCLRYPSQSHRSSRSTPAPWRARARDTSLAAPPITRRSPTGRRTTARAPQPAPSGSSGASARKTSQPQEDEQPQESFVGSELFVARTAAKKEAAGRKGRAAPAGRRLAGARRRGRRRQPAQRRERPLASHAGDVPATNTTARRRRPAERPARRRAAPARKATEQAQPGARRQRRHRAQGRPPPQPAEEDDRSQHNGRKKTARRTTGRRRRPLAQNGRRPRRWRHRPSTPERGAAAHRAAGCGASHPNRTARLQPLLARRLIEPTRRELSATPPLLGSAARAAGRAGRTRALPSRAWRELVALVHPPSARCRPPACGVDHVPELVSSASPPVAAACWVLIVVGRPHPEPLPGRPPASKHARPGSRPARRSQDPRAAAGTGLHSRRKRPALRR